MQLLLLSTSTVHGSGYLEYATRFVKPFFAERNVKRVLFVPYARPSGISHDAYTQKVSSALEPLGFGVDGLHTAADDRDRLHAMVRDAQAVFIGGGNTFLLTKELHERGLMEPLRERIRAGLPYMGSSAGTNMAGLTIRTTNDMPVVQPPSFDALGLLPLQFNCHYLDPDPSSKHMGETRETRLREYFAYGNTVPVLGLREGAILSVSGSKCQLVGSATARLFRSAADVRDVDVGEDLSSLLQQ